MLRFFSRLLARLSVGRKLLLIYLLDLSAVIFISGILINEKFIAIDFARKEIVGNAYIAAVRDAQVAVAQPQAAATLTAKAAAVRAAEGRYGAGLNTATLAAEYAAAVERLAHAPDDGGRPAQASGALASGHALLTRIGNQSNLILDPDLDSYYTMSLLLLRFPDLLDVATGIADKLAQDAGAERTQYFILEGRFDAIAKGIESDYAEALAAASTPALAAGLAPSRASLAAAVDAFRAAARARVDAQEARPPQASLRAAHGDLATALAASWEAAGREMQSLLDTRVHGFFVRMWLHLGTALLLLALLLTAVFFVARQIARPLRHLADVADRVSRTGDYALRAHWSSQDEIGRLVRAFNAMLGELDRNRLVEQELAASARAAAAQQELVDAIPIPLVVTSIPEHDVLHANQPGEAWLNGRHDDPWSKGLDSSVRSRLFQQLADRGAVDEFEVRWRGGPEASWAVLSARRLTYLGHDAVLTAFAPVNHLKSMEQRLELWAKVFEASSESIMIMDGAHHLLSVNRAFVRSTGFANRDVIGRKPAFLDLDGDGGGMEPVWGIVDVRGAWQGEVWVRRAAGAPYPAWLALTAVHDANGVISHYIGISIDITDRKQSEERIRYLAHHDVLTDLPNRSLCNERLRLSLAHARRSGTRVAVLFVDLDRFKNVNDSLGHHVGDALLRSVAQRLQGAVRAGDTVSRLGGDEFVVVLANLESSEEVARLLATRLLPAIRAPHDVIGELAVSCSVGVAIFPEDGDDLDVLMRNADAAMYEAKASGRDQVNWFTEDLNRRAQERLSVENALRHAIERGELSIAYQPRIDAATGRLRGVEALARWTHPELGAVSPRRFVPIAEECGLIHAIGGWVLDQACRQLAQWNRAGIGVGGGSLTLSINVSALQLRDPGLIPAIAGCLDRHGVRAGDIELELTESILMEGVELTLRQLQALKALGLVLSIDDFGTGYSSLNYLSRFPIDKLKIDRSFVASMLEDAADRAITLAIIRLGHTLNLQVVAEGVEHAAQADALRAAACDELQGFHFAEPMAAAAMTTWMQRHLAATTGEAALIAG